MSKCMISFFRFVGVYYTGLKATRLGSRGSFALVRVFVTRGAPPFCARVTVGIGGFLLAGLVDSRALGDAVVVALPDNISVEREGEQALDRLSVGAVSLRVQNKSR